MDAERQWPGEWWVPGNREERVGGIAKYTPERGLELEVFNEFCDRPLLLRPDETPHFDRLHGQIEGEEATTLINCTYTGADDDRQAAAVYRLNYVLEGAFFQPNENIAFDEAEVRFSLLNQWAQLADTDDVIDASDFPIVNAGDTYGVTADIPETRQAWIDGDYIKLSMRFSVNRDRYESGSIDLKTRFKIEPQRPRVPLNEYREHVRRLRNFLALGIGKPVNPTEFIGEIDDLEVNVYYSLHRFSPVSSSVHPAKMNFQFRDIDGQLEEVMRSWYEMSEDLETVLELYFGTQYNSDMYPFNTLLSLTQALESYHRKTHHDQYMLPIRYEETLSDLRDFLHRDMSDVYEGEDRLNLPSGVSDLDEILDSGRVSSVGELLETLDDTYSIPNDFKNKLSGGTFKYANEYSLRKRLREVVREHEDILEDLPHNIVDQQHSVIETRNHLTHRDDVPDPAVAEGQDLVRLTWGLQQLIETCLLSELGIPEGHMETRLHKRYQDRRFF